MTKIKIMLCALALSGCSAGVQPTFPDLGMSEADGATSDAPDAGQDEGLDPDAGVDPDLGPAPDAGGDPDLGLELDAGGDPDLGPAPDAGLPACINTRELCGDGRCCNEPCMDGICRVGHAVSGTYCACDHVTCPAGASMCDNGLAGTCACP